MATLRSSRFSTEVLADLHRVTGLFHAHSGDLARGWASLARSARILAAIGHNSARAAVVSELRGLVDPSARTAFDDAERDRKPWPAVEPRWPAPATQAGANHVASALDKAAALCDFAPYPEILAAEAASLLLDACASTSIALLTRTASGTAATTAATWSQPEDEPAAAPTPPVIIELGHRRDLDFQLAVIPRASLAARSTVLAVKTVIDAACALETARREKRESTALWPIEPETDHPKGIFVSEKMTELVAVARKVADGQAIVLLTGETGTGKEVLARLIHESSSSARQPFVPFNCSSAPRELVDSQLFGYKRGAFTGAVASFDGVVRAAAGGILFLDEIGDLPLEVQPKLLRFIEMNEVHPLGEPHPVKVKVRIIAATNADIEHLVAEGRFREDLYYRLNVIRLHLPPLRERREEIPTLANHYLSRFAAECKKDNLRIAEETMEYLLLWRWPGNVRELVNEIRRMVALAEPGAVLMPEHLSRQIVESRRTVPAAERALLPTEIVVRLDQPHAAMTEHAERSQILWALSVCGTREAAARALGLSRKGLYLKCRRLGIDEDGPEPQEDR
ncbi:MAG: sigma-54 interaction domain-containing protein [Vicinamibacterales bacterium]